MVCVWFTVLQSYVHVFDTVLRITVIFCVVGYKVSATMRKGILQVDIYDGAELELMLGMFSALSK